MFKISNKVYLCSHERQINHNRFRFIQPYFNLNLSMEHFNQHRIMYNPKNNWHFNGQLNTCFTDEEFHQLEEEYAFAGQDIYIKKLACDIFGDFHFDFTFMGVEFKGKRKLDSVNRALWNSTNDDRHREYIVFELSSELLASDNMNDVYQNHELYL